MECMCAQTSLGVYSHPKELGEGGGGVESESVSTPRENSRLPETQRRVEPATLHHAGRRAQHATD